MCSSICLSVSLSLCRYSAPRRLFTNRWIFAVIAFTDSKQTSSRISRLIYIFFLCDINIVCSGNKVALLINTISVCSGIRWQHCADHNTCFYRLVSITELTRGYPRRTRFISRTGRLIQGARSVDSIISNTYSRLDASDPCCCSGSLGGGGRFMRVARSHPIPGCVYVYRSGSLDNDLSSPPDGVIVASVE